MAMNRIYFDNNATTFCAEEVVQRMLEVARMPLANPASQHQFGREARHTLNHASDALLSAVHANRSGMNADKIVYCSGGTEANNLAILGLPATVAGAILVSAIEHPSILAAAEVAKQRGRQVETIPCLSSGVIDCDWIQRRLANSEQPVALVCVMSANNETGILQPVSEVGKLCRRIGVRFHVDAVQALGKTLVDFQAYHADSMTLCAHKLHGPVGVGVLIHRASLSLDPQIVGGMQQSALRSGTESVMLPAGFAKAVERVAGDEARLLRMSMLRDRFEQKLLRECADKGFQIEIIGATEDRLPNTSCVAFPPHSRQALQMAFDLSGLACSTGSACESGSATPSHVLVAMNLPEEVIQSALRFSLSELTTEYEIDDAVSRIVRCLRKKNVPTLH